MKYLFAHLKGYVAEHFNGKLYLATLLWVAFLVSFNFYFDFEDSFIDSFIGSYLRVFLLFLIHLVSYIVTCYFIERYTNAKFLSNKTFWIVLVIGFALLAFDRGHHYNKLIAQQISDQYFVYAFSYKILQRWGHLFSLIIPLFLYYWFYLKKFDDTMYGLNGKVAIKEYFILILFMLPLIYGASFSPSFLRQYPNYESAFIPEFIRETGFNETVTFIVYQIGYALGFFNVELFFRGFLIFALVRFVGPHVILPMAVTYCVLHFGKPLGEAISSLFGGYILGILALRTKNIYGGIMVHIGIAWLMEIFAWWQKN